MLAKSITCFVFFASPLVCVSCKALAAPLLYAKSTSELTRSAFCKKYNCKINLDGEDENTLVYDIVAKSTTFDPVKTQIELLFLGTSVSKITLNLGLDYPNNKLSPEYARLIDDFHRVVTGEGIIKSSEYFYGGKITKCYDTLYSIQLKNKGITQNVIYSSSKLSKLPYITYCNQYFLGAKTMSNRFLTITKK